MWQILSDIDHKQTTWVEVWHESLPNMDAFSNDPLLMLCLYNFTLWHEEDKARDPEAEITTIGLVKNAIDKLNQLRNNAIESIDEQLILHLPPRTDKAVLNSETPGSLADRLFINSLKIFHMKEASTRLRNNEELRQSCQAKTIILEEQRCDLLQCLKTLYDDCIAGVRYFKVYRQMKMYNDSNLNPILFNKQRIG